MAQYNNTKCNIFAKNMSSKGSGGGGGDYLNYTKTSCSRRPNRRRNQASCSGRKKKENHRMAEIIIYKQIKYGLTF